MNLAGTVPGKSDRVDLKLQNKTGMASIGHVSVELWSAEVATTVLRQYVVG